MIHSLLVAEQGAIVNAASLPEGVLLVEVKPGSPHPILLGLGDGAWMTNIDDPFMPGFSAEEEEALARGETVTATFRGTLTGTARVS